MGAIEQSKRLLGIVDRKANGNAFMALTALTGVIGWGVTVLAIHMIAPMPAGQSVNGPELEAWINQAMVGWKWPVMGIWIVAWFGRFVWGYLRVERGSVVNLPNTIWFVASLAATVLNVVAVVTSTPELIWLPWMATFAVGYLSTAYLVERSHVYWVAGVVSTALTVHGVYAVLTTTGHAVVGSGPAAEYAGVGTILMPLPYTYVILGLVHVVPMAIDAWLGGRQLTDAGIPKVRADRQGDPSAEREGTGGVVPK